VNKVATSAPDELAQACAEFMFANDNVSQGMGMRVEQSCEGYAVVSMPIRKTMLNGHQTCHGGLLFSLADSAFAFACNSQNQAAVAAQCSIDFIRPAHFDDVVTATAKLVHQGKRSGVYTVEIVNQRGELIAFFKGNSARIKKAISSPR
jgi:acyl-CoA thioesterase